MAVTLYNTLTSRKEEFVPIHKGKVSMYHCGPTVYDSVHIGNLRTATFNDLLRRMFEFSGYKVQQVMNITDIDDKTLRRSKAEGISLEELTQKYEKKFFDDVSTLHILRPHNVLRATEHIEEMVKIIGMLLEKDIAYATKDGVYMSIGKVKNYGELAHLTTKDIIGAPTGHERIASDEYEKENPRDFALWKFHCEDDGKVYWHAPFGKGRPGWHIECSAMAHKAIGPTVDIHTGGADLLFPHHTNEIAQSESAFETKFVNYWMHGGMMNMNDEKMSKSKGNIFKLDDLLEEKIAPLAYRFWLLQAHYRTQVNFKLEALRGAQQALIRFIHTYISLPEGGTIDENYKEKFLSLIQDDLNMPEALALAFELLKDPNVKPEDKKATLRDFDQVFGINFDTFTGIDQGANEKIPQEIEVLASLREEARNAKEWDKADALRKEINERGYEIKDEDKGYSVRKM
ncbi:MAG: cysteine--tRNA ligase [Patescibacteria group bacterium]